MSFSEGWRKGFPFLLILKGRVGHPWGEGTVTSCRQGSSVAEAASGVDCPLQGYLEGLLGCHGDHEALLPWSQVWGVYCAELSGWQTSWLVEASWVQEYDWLQLLRSVS